MESNISLYRGDCNSLLLDVPDGSIDLLLTDPPYGQTNAKWDKAPDIDALFKEFWRVTKPNGAVVIFGTVKSGLDWIISQRKYFRYDIVWVKTNVTGFLDAKKKPLKCHEMIYVFYKSLPTYNPQFTHGEPYKRKRSDVVTELYSPKKSVATDCPDGRRYPVDVLTIKNENVKFAPKGQRTLHPTQKPLELIKWLVKTYTNEGELVLDPFMGSSTTGLACKQTGRNFIGYELEQKYFDIARKRIEEENVAVETVTGGLFDADA